MTPLISISDLIHESWNFFKNDWKTIVKRNAWLIPVMIAYFALYMAGIATSRPVLILLGLLVLLVGSIFVTLHVSRYLLAKDGGAAQSTQNKSLMELFWPGLVISLVSGLGVLGGSILFLLPGIWFAIASGFALFAYLEEGTTGTSAIGRSMELVKGRWWSTLWRLFVPGLVFQLVLGVISFVVFIVPAIVAGIGGLGAMMSFSEGGSGAMGAASVPILIIAGILFIAAIVINMLLSLVAAGLMQVVQVKLFHGLKASR